jgi:hypothetical protein
MDDWDVIQFCKRINKKINDLYKGNCMTFVDYKAATEERKKNYQPLITKVLQQNYHYKLMSLLK